MRFLSLASRNLKEIYRDPVSILLGVVMPVGLLILFGSIHKNIQLEIFTPQMLTPGIIVFSFAFLVMFSAILLAKDRQSAFLIRLFTTPLKPSDYILSYIVPFIPLAFCQVVACMVVGILLGATFSNILLSLLLFLLVAITCISIGVLLGSVLTVNQVSGVGSVLVTAIGLFGGAWMDLQMVGGIFETIGYLMPFAYAVDASRALLSGAEFSEILNSFYTILGFSIGLFALAIVAFRWSMRRG